MYYTYQDAIVELIRLTELPVEQKQKFENLSHLCSQEDCKIIYGLISAPDDESRRIAQKKYKQMRSTKKSAGKELLRKMKQIYQHIIEQSENYEDRIDVLDMEDTLANL